MSGFTTENVCRTCLGKGALLSLQSIFTSVEGSDTFSFADIINTTISPRVHLRNDILLLRKWTERFVLRQDFVFKITHNDRLPNKICSHCSGKVLEFQKFKLDIENNDLVLKSTIEKHSKIDENQSEEENLEIKTEPLYHEVFISETEDNTSNKVKDSTNHFNKSNTKNEIVQEKNTSSYSSHTGSNENKNEEEWYWPVKQEQLNHEEDIEEYDEKKEYNMTQDDFVQDQNIINQDVRRSCCLQRNMEKKIKLGEVFDSYEEFLETLNNHCKTEFVSFYKRDARSILAAKKKTERYINPKLRYYQLKYACFKGGRQFKSSGSGQRNTSTYKEDCKAHITLRASKCGNKLQIMSTETNHNHEVNKQLHDHLPQQRRLPEDIQSEIVHLSKLKTNRKKIKCYMEEKGNKIILLKDIHNMARKFTESNATDSTLQSSIEKLQTKYGADCHVLNDEDNNFKALLFQTKIMKHYMSAYPEFICIDATFKLLDIRTPVLIIINEDGNGLSEFVAVCILVEESTDTMQWFFSKFKENNPKWNEIKLIMADKDLNERRLLKENFPNANVSICIFHAMRTFNREISTSKFSITIAQRKTTLEILQKMIYSRNSATYNTLYEDLLKNCPFSVIEYFNRNWHNIKDEWTLSPKFQQSSFLNTTNNKVESLNAKIKSMLERYSTLPDFIEDFFKLIMVMNDERDHKAANLMCKIPISFYEKDSTLYKYFMYLTNYAFEFVKTQFLSRNKLSNSNYETTIESCNCEYHTSMLLPCRHIFKTREERSMDVYEESLCNKRWSRNHYFSNQRLFLANKRVDCESDDYLLHSPINSQAVTKSPFMLNHQQKFSKSSLLLKSLAGLISEEDNAKYAKLRQLIQLKTAWENDKSVTILVDKSIEAETETIVDGRENDEISIAVQEAENRLLDNQIMLLGNDNLIFENLPILDDTLNKDNNMPSVMNVTLANKIKKRGRPKGLNNTIIGLPTKKRRGLR